jgi:hypothetical protein
MQQPTQNSQQPGVPPEPTWRSPLAIASIMLLVIGAFYLLREHWGHVAGNWPYLLLLLCPLMHLFMHRGHRGHRGHGPRTQ